MNRLLIIVGTLLLVIVAGCSDSSDAEEGANRVDNNQMNETITNETDVEEESEPIITVSKLSEDEQFELIVKIDTERSKVYKSVKYLGDNDVEIVSALPRVDVRDNNTNYVFLLKRVATNLQPMEMITEESSLSDLTGKNKINVLAKFSIGDHGEDYEIEINDIEVDLKGDDKNS
ncbi:hypothetical protein FLK61_37275 [Paenalkalicoccus suaedae]|uniref:Lipoprotein n=1 Tax=Paenalkalicoccus suaedae TaxID=2592382 RepID=A0A859FGN6_9BACI|nr:hypothetical protein [Paenalkalicoccus suaedae]QKS72289.1 hypothetical protein FLK61_37275 [Paenalkalicoccus suaedae]